MTEDFRTVVEGRWGTLSYAEGRLIQFLSGLAIAPAHPGNGNGDGRRVRHDMVPWLLVEQQAHVKMRRALVVDDAEFEEPLDLSFCTCEYPLRFRNCVFGQGLNVHSAHFCHLEIVGGTLCGLDGASLNVDDDLVLGAAGGPRTEVVGEVRLTDARIGRNLRVQNVSLHGTAGVALRADRIRVQGNVEMASPPPHAGHDGHGGGRLTSVGALRFVGAQIEGTFNASGADLHIVPPPPAPPAPPPNPRLARQEESLIRLMPKGLEPVLLPAGEADDGAETCALDLEGARVDGDVYLKDAACRGEVRLVGATVGDTVDLRGTRIDGLAGEALSADRLKTGGTLFLRFATLRGMSLMQGATIGGSVDMRGAQLDGQGPRALQADRLHVGGHLYMADRFRALGRVDVSYATIEANWVCQDCSFVSAVAAGVPVPPQARGAPGDDVPVECLAGAGAIVEGRLELREGFLSCGVVCLTGITVHQDARLDHANFQCLTSGVSERGTGISLRMERADVRGDLSLKHSFVNGSVRLSGARVRGSLRFNGGWLDTLPAPVEERVELDARRLQVGGEVTFCDATIECNVNLRAAQVQGLLGFERATFVGPARLDARFMRLRGTLAWKRVRLFNPVVVDLSDATLGCIEDDGTQSWPDGGLLLDGCEYASINSDEAAGARERIAWLKLQPRSYLPQPYEQLGNALRRDGLYDDARRVMMEREAARRQAPGIASWLWLRNQLNGFFLGHGYDIKWTLVVAVLVVIVGTFAFDRAYDRGEMDRLRDPVRAMAAAPAQAPASPDAAGTYPHFQPLVYSLDAFLPIVDLRQQEFWLPNRSSWVEWYHWAHIIMGWVGSTLIVVGITAMVRKDP